MILCEITETKLHFLLFNDLMFYGVFSHISVKILLISNLNKPFKSSYKDEPFGTRIIADLKA